MSNQQLSTMDMDMNTDTYNPNTLTPIRVRGRRKRRAPRKEREKNKNDKNVSVNTRTRQMNRLLPSSLELAPRRPSKRQLLLSRTLNAETSGGEAATAMTTTAAGGGKEKREERKQQCSSISILESLPVELLEMIFLYSLNVNLPRASPFLAGALSRERIYELLILLAFWDDSDLDGEIIKAPLPSYHGWNLEKNNETICRILRPLGRGYRPLSSDERGSLQSAIMRCRWCSVERIRSQLPVLVRLIIRRQYIGNVHPKMEDGDRLALDEYLDSNDIGKNPRSFRGFGPAVLEQEQEQDRHIWVLSVFPRKICRIFITRSGGLFSAVREYREYPFLSVKEFPSFLLRGEGEQGQIYEHEHNNDGNEPKPFSKSQMAYIETLCVAGGLVREGGIPEDILKGLSISRDALQEGIHTAIVTNNPRTLSVLLLLDESVLRSRISSSPTNGPGNQYTIPAEHFRTAVRTCRSRSKDRQAALPTDLLRILIWASAESLPSDDPLVTQFAIDVGGVFGKWLLDLMMDNGNLRHSLFYLGKPRIHIPLARRYVEEVSSVPDDDYVGGRILWSNLQKDQLLSE